MGFQESDVISVLQKIFASENSRVKVGIGDDGAILETTHQSVMTSDMAVEDVHFKREWSSAFDIGRKITAANIADILAMGGKCNFLTAAVALSAGESLEWIENLARGMRHEADLAGADIVGGDIARGEKTTISMTAIGSVKTPILRSTAKPGSDIFISSLTGWSAAGLELLTREISINSATAAQALSEFSAPTLDYQIDFSAADAMADISDGILIQADQLARASQVSLNFDQALISAAPEFAELATLAAELDSDIFQWIFAGGEDHVLLATGRDLPGIRVGTVSAGLGISGVEMKAAPVTWSHFQ